MMADKETCPKVMIYKAGQNSSASDGGSISPVIYKWQDLSKETNGILKLWVKSLIS